MSVTSHGLPWLQPLLRRCNVEYYDRITEVHLTGGKYADDVIPQLTRFPHLQKLSLSQTKITHGAVATLRDRLRQCEVRVY